MRLLAGGVSSAHHGQRRHVGNGPDGRGAHPRSANHAAHQVDEIDQHDVQMKAAALLQFAFLFGDNQPTNRLNGRFSIFLYSTGTTTRSGILSTVDPLLCLNYARYTQIL